MSRRGFALVIVTLLFVVCACSPVAQQQAQARACLNGASIGAERVITAGEVARTVAFYPEEHVGGEGAVAAFSIDAHEVTNQQYAAFVAATAYKTVAERVGADGQRIGAAVFDPNLHAWRIDRDAGWRHPAGANSSIEGRDFYPVVQVAYEDALAYAHWRGRRLPTELEWERAARGDVAMTGDIRGEAFAADGAARANTWQGVFPVSDRGEDGFAGLAPVGCFPVNAQGLYDTVGNVWEWTSDWYAVDRAPTSEAYARTHDPQHIAERVIKGGSYLCSRDFCARYRTGSRQPADPGEGMSHVGFRTVGDAS